MEERTIKCPHCDKDIRLDVILTDVKSLELGIGIKVLNEASEEKGKKKSK
ncbi:MAG: hypothetical protein V3V92_06145 [Candidatus Hydrothermarchaeales archaeon]